MSIRLPLAAGPVVASHIAEPPAEVNLQGRRIWIVEDDSSVREALAAYFNQRRCLCQVARSGGELEGLAASGDRAPDYALLDDMLSAHESGLELARSLTKYMESERILMMTGNTDPERWRELTASGFAVMRKPISSAALNAWMLGLGAARDQRTTPAVPEARSISTPTPAPLV